MRNWIFVKPNEPVIQLPYIARHIDATREGYGLGKIQEVDFLPNRPGDPVPSAEELLASPTLKNAPLWPGFVSYLERWLDRQHAQRILQTQGTSMVYGPTLELLQQQQKLRTYYNFLNVDTVRYTIGGEKRMFVSAVRETPLYEPVPWLAYWGQRFMMFTHGFGLVMLRPARSRRTESRTTSPTTFPRGSGGRSSPPRSRASTTAKAPPRWRSPTSTA